MKLLVFVGDILVCLERRNKELQVADIVVNALTGDAEEKGLKLSVTEGGKDVKSWVLASCRYVKEKFQECSKREGVGLADSVEIPGADLRKRTKKLGAKEKTRSRKSDVRFSFVRRDRVFHKNIWGWGCVWSLQECGEDKPHAFRIRQLLTLRQQMARKSLFHYLFSGGEWFGGRGGVVYHGHLFWSGGVWMDRLRTEQQKAWRKQIFQVQRWTLVRWHAGVVFCETRDLDIVFVEHFGQTLLSFVSDSWPRPVVALLRVHMARLRQCSFLTLLLCDLSGLPSLWFCYHSFVGHVTEGKIRYTSAR